MSKEYEQFNVSSKKGAEIKSDYDFDVMIDESDSQVVHNESGLREISNAEEDIKEIGELRQKIENIEPLNEPSEERLLDEGYNLDNLPEGSYRKKTLLEMKAYYKEVRKNIEVEPKEELEKNEKKIAKSIADLPISDRDKIDLILVWRKLKPATDLHITNLNNKISRWLTERKVRKTLDETGVCYDEDFYPENDNCKVFMLSLDRSTTDIMRSENLRYRKSLETQKKDSQKKHLIDYEKAGMFYGYPETAIRAMEIKKEAELRGERIDNFVSADDLPLEIKGIKSFNYSKDNWREEAKTDIRWAKEISLVNSSLHDKFFRK